MHVIFWPIVTAVALATVVVAGPAVISFAVAIKADLHPESRRSFVFICTLLAFGVMFLANIALLPIEFIAGYSAQLQDDGHGVAGKALYLLNKYSSPISIVAGLAACIWLPLRLRRSWNAVWLATR